MNKNNNLLREMPPDETIIQVDVIGRITKKRFLGEFRVRVPTLEDQSSMARHEANLNGDNGPFIPDGVQKINKMVSYLKYTILDAPIFWKDSNMGHALRDPNVIHEVYDQVLAFEDKWLKEIWGEEEKDGSDEASESEEKDT